jgi:hypothetical protein
MCGRLASELRYCCAAGDLRSYWCSRFHWSSSQVALLNLIGTQKALSKLSPGAKRGIQKLRCGWLPVNRRVSAKILIARTAANLARPVRPVQRNGRSHPSMPASTSSRCNARSLCRHVQDLLSWKTSHIVIDALPAGALAWIAGNPAPAVGTLH